MDLLSRLVPTGTKGCFLSRLPDPGQKGTPFCPDLAFPVGKPGQKGFPNRERQAGTKGGGPFVPGLATGTKGYLLSRLVTPTGTKKGCQRHVPGAPCYQPGQKIYFFSSIYLFSILFLFQLYFYISIKFMYWNSVCKISTNIYIVTYIIFVLDSFYI